MNKVKDSNQNIATSAFFPLAISIAVSLGINLEEEGHFQALFVGMESKSKLIIAKLILFLGIGAVAIVILFLPILFSVAVMDQELKGYRVYEGTNESKRKNDKNVKKYHESFASCKVI